MGFTGDNKLQSDRKIPKLEKDTWDYTFGMDHNINGCL